MLYMTMIIRVNMLKIVQVEITLRDFRWGIKEHMFQDMTNHM